MIKDVIGLQNAYKVTSNSRTGDLVCHQWLKIETYDRSDYSLNLFNEQLKRLEYPSLKDNKDIFGWLATALKELLDKEDNIRRLQQVKSELKWELINKEDSNNKTVLDWF